MCEANAYLKTGNLEELMLESVDVIEPRADGRWYLRSIFGEQLEIDARVVSISLVSHRIVFEKK